MPRRIEITSREFCHGPIRVIGGEFKGRKLLSPCWSGLRPTSDRLRGTLFNVLNSRIEDAVFLDGFSGTGAIGIEAISRGAATVVFIERDPRAAALITKNLDRCAVGNQCALVHGSLPEVLNDDHEIDGFDVVVLDPPYECPESEIGGILSAVAERVLSGGCVVLERARESSASDVRGLHYFRRIAAGRSVLDFYGK